MPGPTDLPRDAAVAVEPVLSAVAASGVLDDPERQAAVRRVLAVPGHNTPLDRLSRLAALLLDAPYAQVSLITERQFVVSAHGSAPEREQRQTPAEDSLCTVTLLRGRPLAVADAERDERVSALRPVVDGDVRAYLGVPLRDGAGHLLGALCVHDKDVRTWAPEQVGVLAELAEAVVAELELRALSREASSSAARLGLALAAADIGSFELDPATGALHWDERLVRLFGYDEKTFDRHLDSFTARVHPQDRERVLEMTERAIRTGGELSTEYRIVRPGGDVRWVEARGRMLPGKGSGGGDRLLGVAYDSTELRSTRDRLARLLETMTEAFYSLDDEWRFTYVKAQAERLLGRPREELIGAVLWEEFPQAVASPFEEHYRRAAEQSVPVSFEAAYEPLGGWYEVSAWPGPDGLSVYFREVSARRQAQEERERAYAEREQAVVERERAYAAAEAATKRLTLLADASTRLAESLEPRQVLERLTDMVVPSLGAAAVVALVAETAATLLGTDVSADPDLLHVVHVAHASGPTRRELTDVIAALPLSTADQVGLGAVVRTGRAEWLPEVPDSALQALAPDEDALAALRALRLTSVLTLPLVNRGRVLGALTVASPSGGAVDRALLGDLASRAAVALDNALLYGAERRTGITLQHSLLPREVPALPGLATAARYLPGATGAFVGGDWYQGVRIGDGMLLAMGDVMGHGMRSAARMGQLRAIVATLALEGHAPGRLLTRLAESVDVLLDLELATLLVTLYDPAEHTLTMASAGHPPPLLAPRSGPPRFLDLEPGPPLGSFPVEYEEAVVQLSAGDTLVLYTDGLVEERGESLDVGLERLRRAVVDERLPPGQVCDHVLGELGRGAGSDDDVALLVFTVDPDEVLP